MFQALRRVVHGRKPKLQVRNPRLAPVIDIFENDDSATFLLGSPGYRVARGRSGLGWIETQAELARFEGTMIRWLFVGKFYKTKDPLVLFSMIFIGTFLGGIPLTFILTGLLFTDLKLDSLAALIGAMPNLAIGISILIGASLSILEWSSKSKPGD